MMQSRMTDLVSSADRVRGLCGYAHKRGMQVAVKGSSFWIRAIKGKQRPDCRASWMDLKKGQPEGSEHPVVTTPLSSSLVQIPLFK